MKEEIIKISKENNIDIIGFCNTKELVYDRNIYELQEKLNYKCSFQTGDINDKLLLSYKYKDYNTAIAIGIRYYKNDFKDKNKVYLSSCSIGEDYHIILKNKLLPIKCYLEKNNYKAEIYVDNNSLDERLIAYNAGLGFYGKNNLLINEKLGSYFYIGIILTNAIIKKDNIVNKTCLNCNLCIKVCPNNAINNGLLDSNKCLSYLTQNKHLEEKDYKYLNNCIYGCDKCISICPYNKNVKYKNEEIDPNEFLNMSLEEYKRQFENKSCYWRGKKILDRNIKIYMNNLKK